ncbi:hypothetical protein [Mesorhizobium sp. DCY119]|uniref:hypothetical protein n=1 Tax=Mesorhizobium sp. DCY119 TaxID=2108445 RepID=UPI000EEADEC9|nr:hypothetical protein [Mesorhizobium sp. DCY119]RJG46636.1 hypothetical protein D3Y55_21865 [Mesorhizobium sp. DCY119]
MNAIAASFKSLSVWFWDNPRPDPEPFCAKPRPMTGFWSTLTEEQKARAMKYRGEENHGDKEFAK